MRKLKVGDKVLGRHDKSGEIVELKEIEYPFGNYTLARVQFENKIEWINTIYLKK